MQGVNNLKKTPQGELLVTMREVSVLWMDVFQIVNDSIGDCGAGGSTGGDVGSYGDWYQNGNSSMLLYIFIMFSCNEIRIAQPCIWSDIN